MPFESTTNLTNIPLGDVEHDNNANNVRIVENLRRALDEKDVQIQQMLNENISLNDAIKRLHKETKNTNHQMELLDQQHSEAMRSMLTIKADLQTKCEHLQNDLHTIRTEQVENTLKFDHLYKEHTELLKGNEQLVQKFDEVEKQLASTLDENNCLANNVSELRNELENKTREIGELHATLEEKDSHSRDGSDKFELIDMEKDKLSNSSEVNRLQQEMDEINERLSILNDIKDQYDSNVLKLGSVVNEKNKLEEQLSKLNLENANLLEEVQVTREAVEKLEILQKNLDAINSEKEKEQNEMTFVTLQEDELVLQRDYNQLKADNEKLLAEFETTKTNQDENVDLLEAKCTELESKIVIMSAEHEKLNAENQQCQEKISELQSSYDTLKLEASDIESRLVEENMLFQKQVIDLQSLLNSRNVEGINDVDTTNAITFDEIRTLISKTVNYEPSSTHNSIQLYLEGFLRSVYETYQHLEDIEKNRDDLMKQFEAVSNEKATLKHERKTLKADLHHYEKEVAELMKNNEILLVELENIKTGKLETISEHNEDNILRLENQLEDCSKLNQSLEDEYENMRRKLDEKEEEKYELIERIATLEQQLEVQAKNYKEIKTQLQDVDLEKTNMQFQMDQLKMDDSELDREKLFEEKIQMQNEEIYELNRQLENLNVDHASLVRKIEPLQDEKQKLQVEIEQLKKALHSVESTLVNLQAEYDQFKESILQDDFEERLHLVTAKYDEKCNECTQANEQLNKLINENDITVAKLNQTIAELQQKNASGIESTSQNVEILTKEKQELIAAIQMKHNENVQYHSKIQELNQLLANQQQQFTVQEQQKSHCNNCIQLTDQLQASNDEIVKLNDQIGFLKEKSDILTQNMLIEQTNQKLMTQERVELVEEKQTIIKDLNRLREHLIEMENAHTLEMVELQDTLEKTRQEIAAMQADARKSSTAYTSAR